MDDEGFVVTKEYRRFVEFCDACRRERYIGLCYGPPGVGKTISARHYAHWEVVEAQIRNYVIGNARSPDAAAARTILYTPMVANTPRTVDKEVSNLSSRLNFLIEDTLVAASEAPTSEDDGDEVFPVPRYAEAQHVELLIVDEADRLRMPSLEQLRDHYDRRKIGLILIGMPGMEKRLARYPQLYSRVGFVHQYRALGAEELRFILEAHCDSLGLRFSRRTSPTPKPWRPWPGSPAELNHRIERQPDRHVPGRQYRRVRQPNDLARAVRTLTTGPVTAEDGTNGARFVTSLPSE